MFKKIIQLIRSKFVRSGKAEAVISDTLKSLPDVTITKGKIKAKKTRTKKRKEKCATKSKLTS